MLIRSDQKGDHRGSATRLKPRKAHGQGSARCAQVFVVNFIFQGTPNSSISCFLCVTPPDLPQS